MEQISYQKSLPVWGSFDVAVAGSGPAGICAAVAAARQGARVLLIERYGVLGGMLTSGGVGPILGMVGKGTMRDELVSLLGVPENDMIGRTGRAHDVERAKHVLAEFVAQANVQVLLQTPVVDVVMEGSRVRGLVLGAKDGPCCVLAKTIVDCTGDGDVAYLAGAPWEKGREDGLMQPVTLEYTIDGVDESRGLICIGDVDDVRLNGQRFLDFCAQRAAAGALPENLAAVRLHPTTQPGQRRVNTTQVNGVDMTDPAQIFAADRQLRQQMEILTEFLRREVPGYENCRCISSPATTGVRETRRILGEYKITAEELVAGKRFPDVVVHDAEFIVDIHNPAGPGQAEAKIAYVKPYDLPYGCFVPLQVEGLLVAGRCISGTHRAHASYRVMSICMAMGQAIGTAAALCARADCLPRYLEVSALQEALQAQGVVLF